MKNIILITFLFFSIFVFSQQKGLVKYGYIPALDIGKARGVDYNSYLVFNKQLSKYVTLKDSLEERENKNKERRFDVDGKGVSVYSGMSLCLDGEQVVYHINKNTMWSSSLEDDLVYVKETAPKINWKLVNETKKIGKFLCKKAVANFRGRDYTAWYTKEIPVPYGPWKLHGLPGLILEAYDTDKFVYWYFKSVEYPTNNEEKVEYMELPKNKKFITYQEYKAHQRDVIEKTEDKIKVIRQSYPNAEIKAGGISNFIERE